jgi:purine-binding chemotaxis protein CheW
MSDTRPDQFILFVVAATTYALPSESVAHVEMVEEVTRVPNAPAFVDGVVFSRGQVVPAVNLRARFGFERAPNGVKTRLLVVQSRGRGIGLLADECREFLRIPASAIHPAGEALTGIGAQYITSIATIGDRMIVVLNLDDLLNTQDPILAA